MPTPTPEVEEIVNDFENKFCQDITDVGGYPMASTIRNWLRTELTSLTQKHKEEIEKAREEERERIADVLWRYGLIRSKDDVASYCTRPHPHQNR